MNLRFRDGQCVRSFDDGVPDLLSELDSFRDAELLNVVERQASHARIVNQLSEYGKAHLKAPNVWELSRPKQANRYLVSD